MPFVCVCCVRDAQEIYLGLRIAVEWSGNRWYKGTVMKYEESKGHYVRYDDGDERCVLDLGLCWH